MKSFGLTAALAAAFLAMASPDAFAFAEGGVACADGTSIHLNTGDAGGACVYNESTKVMSCLGGSGGSAEGSCASCTKKNNCTREENAY